MAEDEIKNESEEKGGEEDLWAAAAEDLEKQRVMLHDAAKKDKEGGTEAAEEAEEAEGAVAAVKEPESKTSDKASKIDMILDIPLHLSVELGRTKMLINDLLQLGQGSVIELTKLVGEPLEVLVNEKLVAKGEVVVVNEKFGVRLTEVIAHKERIESLS